MRLGWLVLPLVLASASPAAACDISPIKIFFPTAATRLSDDDKSAIGVMQSLAEGGGYIRLTGHTDTAGSAAGNLLLSRLRVEAVRAHLVRLGLPAERILTESFGESRSITALDDGRSDERHRYVLIELMSPEEARKGRAGRARTSCGD